MTTHCEDMAVLEPVTGLEVVTVLADDKGRPLVEWVPCDNPFSRIVGAFISHSGRKVSSYSVEETATDEGRAFVLKALSGGTDEEGGMYCVTTYHTGTPKACECRGHLRWGTTCKHMLAMGALVRAGLV